MLSLQAASIWSLLYLSIVSSHNLIICWLGGIEVRSSCTGQHRVLLLGANLVSRARTASHSARDHCTATSRSPTKRFEQAPLHSAAPKTGVLVDISSEAMTSDPSSLALCGTKSNMVAKTAIARLSEGRTHVARAHRNATTHQS